MLLRRCISSSSNTRVLLSALEVKPKKSDNVTVGLTFWMNRIITQVVEFLCVIVPIISIFTVLPEWTCACAICLVLVLIIWIVTKRFVFVNSYDNESHLFSSSIRMSLSSYHVFVMTVICICILAVDFKIYPRRYAKTETFGTGLVFGSDSWILELGWILCGGKCICFKTSKDYYIIEMGRLHFNLFMWGNMVSIGIFCTLAAVSILSTMINICPQHCGVLGDSVIIGYWGMYLVGIHLRNYLFFESGNETRGNWWAMISVWFLSLLFCLVLFL